MCDGSTFFHTRHTFSKAALFWPTSQGSSKTYIPQSLKAILCSYCVPSSADIGDCTWTSTYHEVHDDPMCFVRVYSVQQEVIFWIYYSFTVFPYVGSEMPQNYYTYF